MSKAIDHGIRRRLRYLDALAEWLGIPSVSTDPAYAPEMRRAAKWAADHMRGLGFRDVELFGPESHPAVYGELPSSLAGAPKILVYGHYDVQPTDPEEAWQSGPFAPEARDDRLYARGAADMKGPALSALCALEALVATGVGAQYDVKILLEGEEEIGSPNLERLILERQDALRCDVCLNLDAGMLGADLPTLAVAVRGIASFNLRVSGPSQDLHSGDFGGAVHNPAQALCQLIAGLHDDQGRVALGGFYDRVRELDEDQRSALRALPPGEKRLREQAGVSALWGEAGYAAQERVGSRPTLDIHGLCAGFQGPGSKTIIPATASAKLSTRLVADQDPHEVKGQLEAYLRDHAPPTVSWQLEETGAVAPAESDADSPWSRRMAEALAATWGHDPLIGRVGGTVPVVGLLQRTLGVDSVSLGWALPDGNLHAPNENLHLPTFFRGIEALIRFFGAA